MQSLDFGCSLAESSETALAVDWYSLESLSCVGVSQHFCTVNQGAPFLLHLPQVWFLALHIFDCSLVQFCAQQ